MIGSGSGRRLFLLIAMTWVVHCPIQGEYGKRAAQNMASMDL